jgi:hypothetical protein
VQIMYAEDQVGAYRAGACNIGPAEIARRRQGAYMALAVTVILAAILLIVDAPTILRLAIFPPLAGGLVSLEQVRRRFCVAYGLAGLRNFGAIGEVVSVEETAQRRADRRAALVLIGYASAVALVITLAFVALPV